jgi:RecB family exonuclease
LLQEAGIEEQRVADISFQEDCKERALLQNQGRRNGIIDRIVLSREGVIPQGDR